MEKEKKNIEGKLSESELKNVSGGSSCDSNERYKNENHGSPKSVTFVAQVGEEIEYKNNGRIKAIVLATKIEDNRLNNTQDGAIFYYDKYKVHNSDGTGHDGWINRNDIYKK